jgi:hypothetical protein
MEIKTIAIDKKTHSKLMRIKIAKNFMNMDEVVNYLLKLGDKN